MFLSCFRAIRHISPARRAGKGLVLLQAGDSQQAVLAASWPSPVWESLAHANIQLLYLKICVTLCIYRKITGKATRSVLSFLKYPQMGWHRELQVSAGRMPQFLTVHGDPICPACGAQRVIHVIPKQTLTFYQISGAPHTLPENYFVFKTVIKTCSSNIESKVVVTSNQESCILLLA